MKYKLIPIFIICTPILCKEIAIIGAGLSGLTAAYKLQDKHNVKIYEARNRPGGRVLTCIFENGNYAELGGYNINDAPSQKYIKKLSQELNLELENFNLSAPIIYIDENKKNINFKTILNNMPQPNEALQKKLKEKSLNYKNIGLFLDNFCKNNIYLRTLFEKILASFEGSKTYNVETAYAFDDFWNFYTIFYSYITDKKISIDVCTIKNGMYNIIEKLVQTLKNKIKYNCPLQKIYLNENNKITIKAGNEFQETDIVILSNPLTTLKNIEIDEKLIPKETVQYMLSIDYGDNSKIVAPINDSNLKIFTGQKCDFVVNYPTYLCLYFTNQDFSKLFKSNLNSIFKNEISFIKNMNNYKNLNYTTQNLPYTKNAYCKLQNNDPVAINWKTEPYSKGSYSYCSSENCAIYSKIAKYNGKKIRNLFKPINNRVFFIGEHTSIKNPSTLEGAVESGIKVSKLIN